MKNFFTYKVPFLRLLLLLLLLTMFFSCASTEQKKEVSQDSLRIHYQRSSQSKEPWSLWLWLDTEWKSEKGWPSGKKADGVDFFGSYYDIPLAAGARNLGMLVVHADTGERDGGEKFFSYLHLYKELWIFEGDESIYISEDKAQHQALLNATLINEGQILLTFVDNTRVDTDDIVISRHTTAAFQRRGRQEILVFLRDSVEADAAEIRITAQYEDDIIPISLSYEFVDKHYANDEYLGLRYDGGSANFTVWAPLATKVQLVLYSRESQFEELFVEDMIAQQRGIWSVRVDGSRVAEGDLHGHYYQYRVVNQGNNPQLVLDPYAASMAIFFGSAGDTTLSPDIVGRGAIINPARTKMARGQARPLKGVNKGPLIYYELDIRDFSSDEYLQQNGQNALDAQWGTYDALAELLDYIKNLGVSHVILRDVLSVYHHDERSTDLRTKYRDENQFRQAGFDAHHFFAPEGFYSSDPRDPALRIRELKNLVYELHARKLGVIAKVSYSKIARASVFERLVPNYYILNEIGGDNSDRARYYYSLPYMAQRLVLDSVENLIETYGFDGIFLEHMGSLDRKLVERIHDRAKGVSSEILILGDAARSLDVSLFDIDGADIDWNPQEKRIQMLNPEFPRLVTTQNFNLGEPSFIAGRPHLIYSIFENLLAKPSLILSRESQDLIQYLNDYQGDSLFDRLFLSQELDPNMSLERVHKQIKIAHTLLFSSRGSVAIAAGQELGQSKAWQGYQQGSTINASDTMSHFPWALRNNPVAQDTLDYVRDLIEWRKTVASLHQEDALLADGSFLLSPVLAKGKSDSDTQLGQIVPQAQYDDAISYQIRDIDGTQYVIYLNVADVPRSFVKDFDTGDASLLATIDGFVSSKAALKDYVGADSREFILPAGPSLAIVKIP